MSNESKTVCYCKWVKMSRTRTCETRNITRRHSHMFSVLHTVDMAQMEGTDFCIFSIILLV